MENSSEGSTGSGGHRQNRLSPGLQTASGVHSRLYLPHCHLQLCRLLRRCVVAMSSLSATQSDAFYFPPDYDPSKHGSLSKFNTNGKWKGANQYQLNGVIRFELPFDGWCLKCNKCVGKGTRFNASKKKDGNYFSTVIQKFEMKCYDCSNVFIIKTDPQNDTYNYFEGIRKMEHDYDNSNDYINDPDEISQNYTDYVVSNINDRSTTSNIGKADPIERMILQQENKRKVDTLKEQFEKLEELQYENKRFDFDKNSLIREKFRKVKTKAKDLQLEGQRLGLAIPLLDSSAEDVNVAKLARFRETDYMKKAKVNERTKMLSINMQSIFKESGAQSSLAAKHNRMTESLMKQARVGIAVKGSILNSCDTASRDIGVTTILHKRKRI